MQARSQSTLFSKAQGLQNPHSGEPIMSNDVKLEQAAREYARRIVAEHFGYDVVENVSDHCAEVEFVLMGIKAARHQSQQRDAVLEEAAKACEEQRRIFASPEYAAGQPLSSFGERFGAGRCAEAIRALKTTPAPATEHGDSK
jgi:hypothetical protein